LHAQKVEGAISTGIQYSSIFNSVEIIAFVTYAHSQCVEIFGTLDRDRLLVIIYLSHH